MNFLHYEYDAGPDDVIVVTLNSAANVQLLSPADFENYRRGQQYKYHGGYVTQSPFHIRPPYKGLWHLVIDLGGYAGTIRASARLLSSERSAG